MHTPRFPRLRPLALVATLLLVFTASDAAANTRPSISGTPPQDAVIGTPYSFRPTASDPDGQRLSFAISRKPSWAKFDNRTGRLYGRPAVANIGTYKNIRIAVSDGTKSSYIGPFRINVRAATSPGPTTTTGSATVRWLAPTRNSDGSALSNLAGYKVRYGTNRSSLNKLVNVTNAGATSVQITGLNSATWYFTVAAYTNTGIESEPSAMASKTIN